MFSFLSLYCLPIVVFYLSRVFSDFFFQFPPYSYSLKCSSVSYSTYFLQRLFIVLPIINISWSDQVVPRLAALAIVMLSAGSELWAYKRSQRTRILFTHVLNPPPPPPPPPIESGLKPHAGCGLANPDSKEFCYCTHPLYLRKMVCIVCFDLLEIIRCSIS